MLKREYRLFPSPQLAQSHSSLSNQSENTFLLETEHNSDVDESIREEIELRSAQSITNKSYVFPRVNKSPYKLPMIPQKVKKSFTIVRASNYFGGGLLTSEKRKHPRPLGRTILMPPKSKTPVPNKLLSRLVPLSSSDNFKAKKEYSVSPGPRRTHRKKL